jgi:hypothetical protein
MHIQLTRAISSNFLEQTTTTKDLQYQTSEELRRQKQYVSQEMGELLWNPPNPINSEQTTSLTTEVNQLRERLEAIDRVMDDRRAGVRPKGMEEYLFRRVYKPEDNMRYFAAETFFSKIRDAFNQRFDGVESTDALESGRLDAQDVIAGKSGFKTRALVIGAGVTVALAALVGWIWIRFKRRKAPETSPSRQHAREWSLSESD